MKTLTKLAIAGAMAGVLALTAIPSASAAVQVGIGIGAPAYGPSHRHWCWRHPGACHRGSGVVVVGPRIGVFYGSRGWWDGHRYWAHRERWHGHWRYR